MCIRDSIRGIKRYAVDHCSETVPVPAAMDDTGKKVAIIGGGPGGLYAAYFLSIMGHKPTIFEKSILKYPGAKNRLASWLCEYIPKRDVDVEPFAGSLAVFFNKQRSHIETCLLYTSPQPQQHCRYLLHL